MCTEIGGHKASESKYSTLFAPSMYIATQCSPGLLAVSVFTTKHMGNFVAVLKKEYAGSLSAGKQPMKCLRVEWLRINILLIL